MKITYFKNLLLIIVSFLYFLSCTYRVDTHQPQTSLYAGGEQAPITDNINKQRINERELIEQANDEHPHDVCQSSCNEAIQSIFNSNSFNDIGTKISTIVEHLSEIKPCRDQGKLKNSDYYHMLIIFRKSLAAWYQTPNQMSDQSAAMLTNVNKTESTSTPFTDRSPWAIQLIEIENELMNGSEIKYFFSKKLPYDTMPYVLMRTDALSFYISNIKNGKTKELDENSKKFFHLFKNSLEYEANFWYVHSKKQNINGEFDYYLNATDSPDNRIFLKQRIERVYYHTQMINKKWSELPLGFRKRHLGLPLKLYLEKLRSLIDQPETYKIGIDNKSYNLNELIIDINKYKFLSK